MNPSEAFQVQAAFILPPFLKQRFGFGQSVIVPMDQVSTTLKALLPSSLLRCSEHESLIAIDSEQHKLVLLDYSLIPCSLPAKVDFTIQESLSLNDEKAIPIPCGDWQVWALCLTTIPKDGGPFSIPVLSGPDYPSTMPWVAYTLYGFGPPETCSLRKYFISKENT